MKKVSALFILAILLLACGTSQNQSSRFFEENVSDEYSVMLLNGFTKSNKPNDKNIDLWHNGSIFFAIDRRSDFDLSDLYATYQWRIEYYQKKYLNKKQVAMTDSLMGFLTGKQYEIGVFACLKRLGNSCVLLNYEGPGANLEDAQYMFNSLKTLKDFNIYDTVSKNAFLIYDCEEYTIKYPAKWELVKFPKETGDFYCGELVKRIGFSMSRAHEVNKTLEEVKDISLQMMYANYLKAKSEKTSVKGFPAYKITMEGFDDGSQQKAYIYYFFAKNVLYTIRFGSDPKIVDEYLSTFDEILNSIEIK